jgi:hypothetical protein
MTNITLNNRACAIPAAWDEMTRQQLLFVAGLTMNPLPVHEFKIKVLIHFAGWKLAPLPVMNPDDGVYVLHKGEMFWLKPWHITAMCEKLDFLFTETETRDGKIVNINSKLGTNLLLKLRCGVWYQRLRPLYGPANRFYNVRFGEFIAADNFFRRWMATKQDEFLDKLIAVLYRPADRNEKPDSRNFHGDRRQPFNEHNINSRAKQVSRISPVVKMAVALWYNGCLHHLSVNFPHCFGGGGNQKSRFGSLTLVQALTNGDVTKSRTVRNEYLWDVFMHLEQTMINHQKSLENIKKS